MPRYTLAIESSNPSTAPGSVALAHHNSTRPLALELLHTPRPNYDDLITAIDRLFRAASASPRDLGAIALSIGPGGYTSLRIAVATAKMLADSSGAQTIPIPTALIAAFPLTLPAIPALVLLASKNDSAHATLLPTPDHAQWPRAHQAIGLITADRLASLRPGVIIADRFLPIAIRDQAAHLNIPILAPELTADAVIGLAPSFPAVDPLALIPLYPREPEAVTLWQKRQRT